MSGWHQHRRDGGNTAYDPETVLSEKSVDQVWTSSPLSGVSSEPLLVGRTVFTTSMAHQYQDSVAALNQSDGTVRWTGGESCFELDNAPAFCGGLLATLNWSGKPMIQTFDTESGEQRGSYGGYVSRSTRNALGTDGRALYLARPGAVNCLEVEPLRKRWCWTIPEDVLSSVAVGSEVVVVASHGIGMKVDEYRDEHGERRGRYATGPRVRAFDKEHGSVRWRTDADMGAPRAAVLREEQVFVVGDYLVGGEEYEAAVVSLDRRTGEQRWLACFDGRCNTAPAASPDLLTVLVGGQKESKSLLALEADDGRVRWRQEFTSRNVGAPTRTRDSVVLTVNGELRVLDTATGKERWRVGVDCALGGPVSTSEGWLFVGGDDGAVHAFRHA